MTNITICTLVSVCCLITGAIIGGIAQEEKTARECDINTSTVLKPRNSKPKPYVCFAKKGE